MKGVPVGMYSALHVGHRQIKSLLVRCGNHKDGCTWEGELRSSAIHARNKCQYREVDCPLGCEEKMKWINLASHQERECKNRPTECPECLETGTNWYITGDHVEDCLMVLSECPLAVRWRSALHW